MQLSISRWTKIFLQEVYAAENAVVFGSYFVAEFGKRRVPCRIVRKQQSTGTEIGKGGPIFPQHMSVGAQAIGNEDINRA